MTRTFLVAINVESSFDLTEEALDIQEELLNSGFDVISVKPWASTALSVKPTELPPL